MSRYPTDKRGIAISPLELGYTPVEHKRGVTSNHHHQYEKRRYQATRIHQLFRGLIINVTPLYISEHNELHREYEAPRVPDIITMQDVLEEYIAINGVLDIVREHQTNQTYQVTTDQWELVRGAHGLQVYGARNSISNLFA